MTELRRADAGVRFRCARGHRWTHWSAEFRTGGRFEADVAAAEVCPICGRGFAGDVELVRRTVTLDPESVVPRSEDV